MRKLRFREVDNFSQTTQLLSAKCDRSSCCNSSQLPPLVPLASLPDHPIPGKGWHFPHGPREVESLA